MPQGTSAASTVRAAHRSDDPHGVVPSTDLLPPAIVAQAAAGAQTVVDEHRSAYPLGLAGLVTAAASLESAHLHSTAREQADLDGGALAR